MKPHHESEVKQSDTPIIDAAIAFYEEQIRNDPADIDSRAELAVFYGVAGRATDAVREFNTCLQRNSSHGRALLGFGVFLCVQGNPGEGAKKLETAVNFLEPGDQISATGLLGAAYHMSGDLLRAIDCWETLLDPVMEPLIGFEVHLSLGIACLQNRWIDRAIHELTIARALAKDDSSTMPRRFPGVALDMGRDRLLLWVENDKGREFLDLTIPLVWGICRLEDIF